MEQRWCNLCKRVPPKSFVQPQYLKTEVFRYRDSQGLRRPRFSFFIFTCQTARGPKTPLPSLEGSLNPHSTANDNRLVSAVDSLILVRSLQARKLALAKVQDSAALSGR